MPAPLLALVAIVAVLSIFVRVMFVSPLRLSRPLARTVDCVLAVLLCLTVVGYGSGSIFDPSWARGPGFVGATWAAALLYLCLGGLVVGAVLLAIRIKGVAQQRDSAPTRMRVARVGAAVVALTTAGTVGYGLVEAAQPQVTHTTIASDGLPQQFDGLRIAFVSDIHAGPTRGAGFVEAIVGEINQHDPDVVILGGDLIDGTVELVGDVLTPLSELNAPLGVFAVTGNHEYYADADEWTRLWSSLGVEVLRNATATLERGGAFIDLAGINDVSAPPPHAPDLGRALGERTSDRFTLLAAHQPVQALDAVGAGIDLQLSGHTHAGQLWPLRYLVPLQQPSIEGLVTVSGTPVFTTRGAGTWGPPVRVGAEPEISMLELHSVGA